MRIPVRKRIIIPISILIIIFIIFVSIFSKQSSRIKLYNQISRSDFIPEKVRVAAILHLADSGRNAIPYLINLLENNNDVVQERVMFFLSSLVPDKKYLSIIITHTKNTANENIKILGLITLSRMNLWNSQVAEIFNEALVDFRPSVRATATVLIKKFNQLTMEEKITKTMEMLRDNNIGVRRVAADNLNLLTTQDFGSEYDLWYTWWLKEKWEIKENEKSK